MGQEKGDYVLKVYDSLRDVETVVEIASTTRD